MTGIRHKLAAVRMPVVAARGGEAAWKVALARGARDAAGLDLRVTESATHRRSLTELLEMPPDQSLICVLSGPKEGLGLMVLDREVMAGVIEMMTIRRVSSSPAPSRRPTRTDAAMVASLVDTALAEWERVLSCDEDSVWAAGFRYTSFLEDARPLGLLLEDIAYRVVVVSVTLGEGEKSGQILLALPAQGRAPRPELAQEPVVPAADMLFRAAFPEQVLASEAVLRAVVARVSLPLQAVLALKPGDPLPLGEAAVDRIDLEGGNGLRLGGGKLGQNRGMRAVRLDDAAEPAARGPARRAATGLEPAQLRRTAS